MTQPIGINGATDGFARRLRRKRRRLMPTLPGAKRSGSPTCARPMQNAVRQASALAILTEQDARLREVERIIGLRAGAGDAAGYDLRRVRLEARSVTAQKALGDGEVRAACATAIRGLPGNLMPAPASRSSPCSGLHGPRCNAATGRSDLAAQRYRVTSAEAQADAARRQRLPDLAVGAGYKRVSEGGLSASGPTISLGTQVADLQRQWCQSRSRSAQACCRGRACFVFCRDRCRT